MRGMVRVSALSEHDTDHAVRVAEIHLAAWQSPVHLLNDLVLRFKADIDSTRTSEKAIFLAHCSDDAAGYCRLVRDATDPRCWWLEGIAVKPRHQRTGVGRALVDACVRYCGTHGGAALRSEAHLDNAGSIAFHRSVGFHDTGKYVAPDGDRKVGFTLSLATRSAGPLGTR